MIWCFKNTETRSPYMGRTDVTGSKVATKHVLLMIFLNPFMQQVSLFLVLFELASALGSILLPSVVA